MAKILYKIFQLLIFSFLFSCSQNNFIEKIKIIKTDIYLNDDESNIVQKLSVYDDSKPLIGGFDISIKDDKIIHNEPIRINDVEEYYEIFTENERELKEYKASALYNLSYSQEGEDFIYGKEIDGNKTNLIILNKNIESLVRKSFAKKISILKKSHLTNKDVKININRLWLVSKKANLPNIIGEHIGQIIIRIKYKNIDKVYEFSNEGTHFISSSYKNNKLIIEKLIDDAVNKIVNDKNLENYIIKND